MLTEREGSLKYFNRNDVSWAWGLSWLHLVISCPHAVPSSHTVPPVGMPPPATVHFSLPPGQVWVDNARSRTSKPFPAGHARAEGPPGCE